MGDMGRPCSICCRSDREEIDRALESGEPLRSIAARFGIGSSSLHRHKKDPRHERAIEPVAQVDQATQDLAAPQNLPVSPLPLRVELSEPEPPTRLKTLSEQTKTETPALPAVVEERPALPKNNGGRPGPCPVCGSKRWRELEGHLTCDMCHPLPPSRGTYVYTGRAAREPGGAATPMMIGGVPSTRNRVPIALS
jgi:hypothetical protein